MMELPRAHLANLFWLLVQLHRLVRLIWRPFICAVIQAQLRQIGLLERLSPALPAPSPSPSPPADCRENRPCSDPCSDCGFNCVDIPPFTES